MARKLHRRRRGNILALTTVLMVVLVAFVALAVDVGYLFNVRNELQRTADAAAIAACWELCDTNGPAGSNDATTLSANARTAAVQFAALNVVGSAAPGLASDDVTVGYMANPSNPNEAMIATPSGGLPNAVKVRVQRNSDQNGEVPLFFARVLGMDDKALEAEATAALLSGFKGFSAPADGDTIDILPFALDEQTWNNLAAQGTDLHRYDAATKSVSAGSDNIREVNLFPQGTGSSGNRGTVDIGSSNNSTADIARQIVQGVNATDLAHHGGSLTFDGNGELHLNGDTGISAGVKDELVSIIGKPRLIPIFSAVYGPGNNAEYTIVKFVGVRVMAVKLTGSMSGKYVRVQPCNVVAKGGIYEAGATGTQYVYSPVWLVR
jgi:Flp pilus assembly protein TadG